jgi:uncharacterized membrane protein
VTTTCSPERRLGLDALRGVAVLLMIEQHVGVWLWRPGASPADIVMLVVNALGGMAAPLFIMLAGVGGALYVATGRPSRTLVLRGLALVGFGLVLNLLAVTWFSASSWFVLHMIGAALLLAGVWRRLPTPALLVFAVAFLVVTPVVQAWLATPVPLDNARMSDGGLPGGAVRLAFAEGHFPLLPWLAVAVAGFVAGRWLVEGRLRPVVWLAVAAAASGAGGHLLLRGATPSGGPVARAVAVHPFYPASVTVVLLLTALGLLLIAAVTVRERRRAIAPTHPLVALGRASLTLLLVHVPLFRELTQVAGVYRTLPPAAALMLVVLVLLVATVLARRWQRYGYRYGAEWLLRRLDDAGSSRPPAVSSASRVAGGRSAGGDD